MKASTKSRVAVIEKPAISLLNEPPRPLFSGTKTTSPRSRWAATSALQVKQLLPTVPGLDYAVNTMSYEPGAALAMVEIHVMEHGLLMLEGGGIYRLGELLVSGAGRRFYLDGALLPAVVWCAGQDPGKVPDLQRLESPPASRTVNVCKLPTAHRSRSIAL